MGSNQFKERIIKRVHRLPLFYLLASSISPKSSHFCRVNLEQISASALPSHEIPVRPHFALPFTPDSRRPGCPAAGRTDRAGHSGHALYFSRSPIPFPRGENPVYWKHIGLYVYRRGLLLGYSALKPGPLEAAEKLEQLRALENGIAIRVAETEYETIGVDTPEDLAHVQSLFIPTNHG